MINSSKTSKKLIGVSLISSLLVLWLGSNFLSDAHTQVSGATHLQNSVAPEITLFNVAHSLDEERATTQRVLSSDGDYYDEVADELRGIKNNTISLFEQARREILLSRKSKSKRIKNRFTDESVENLLNRLDDSLSQMKISGSILVRQSYLPHERRDEEARMQMYDAYNNLIAEVNKLRKRTHALPDETYVDVIVAHEIKNSIWALKDSINQNSILIESFLLKTDNSAWQTINAESLALRLLQQHERATQALSELSELSQSKSMAGVSSNVVTELEKQYNKDFHSLGRHLILSSPLAIDTAIEIPKWKGITKNTKDKLLILENEALSNTLSTADDIKQSAISSLIFNAFLVLLCGVMAYATFRIANRIQHQADHDDLTGMPNRRFFNSALESYFKKTDISNNEKLVLMTLDLNGFKNINDTMGHVAGDHLLKQVADRLTSVTSTDKAIARMGGDEFAVCFLTEDPAHVVGFAHQLRDAFEKSFTIDDGQVSVDTSIGYSTYPDDASTVKELQITSDFAMFSAKQRGRKIIQPYDQKLSKQFENRIALEKDLVSAIENNELELYYQPQFNIGLNHIDAVEALIRWNHPTRGMVSPLDFIGVAEETGLMPAVGSWVLNEACRQAAVWNNGSGFPIRVAVNVSVHQIMQSDFVQSVENAIERHGISTACLELEITESVVVADIKWVVKSLSALKSLGIRIALDDFGTGYSSLNQLQELPLDTLKIDQSFIKGLEDDDRKMQAITAIIASIADIYGLETVAEGIETYKQLTEVRNLGIDVAQGYYYSKPLPSDSVLEAIANINLQADESSKAA